LGEPLAEAFVLEQFLQGKLGLGPLARPQTAVEVGQEQVGAHHLLQLLDDRLVLPPLTREARVMTLEARFTDEFPDQPMTSRHGGFVDLVGELRLTELPELPGKEEVELELFLLDESGRGLADQRSEAGVQALTKLLSMSGKAPTLTASP